MDGVTGFEPVITMSKTVALTSLAIPQLQGKPDTTKPLR